MIVTPVYDYMSHINKGSRFGVVRDSMMTSASQADGRQLKHIIVTESTRYEVSRTKEKRLVKHLLQPHPPAQSVRQTDA